tara:strand:+ start:246 stop:446 length:201 start_codon:yes stop_codon:yes gene_type:complete
MYISAKRKAIMAFKIFKNTLTFLLQSKDKYIVIIDSVIRKTNVDINLRYAISSLFKLKKSIINNMR